MSLLRVRRTLTALATAGFIFYAENATAATVIQTFNCNKASGPCELQAFDSTLGALQSVSLVPYVGSYYDVTITNTSNEGNNYHLNINKSWYFSLGGFSTSTSSSGTISFTFYTLNGSEVRTLGGFSYYQSPFETSAASALALFTGTVPLVADYDLDTTFLSVSPLVVGTVIEKLTAFQGTLTYVYDPATTPPTDPVTQVPEPSTWFMMIIGFALTGAGLRGARSAAASAAGRSGMGRLTDSI